MRPHKIRYIFCCVAAVYTAPAFAYLDPGTGSLLIQGIIASIAAAGALAKLYWHKIVVLFRGGRKPDEVPQTKDADDHV